MQLIRIQEKRFNKLNQIHVKCDHIVIRAIPENRWPCWSNSYQKIIGQDSPWSSSDTFVHLKAQEWSRPEDFEWCLVNESITTRNPFSKCLFSPHLSLRSNLRQTQTSWDESEDNKENLSINYHEKCKYSSGDDNVKWAVSYVLLLVFALLSHLVHEANVNIKLYLSRAFGIGRKSFCWL